MNDLSSYLYNAEMNGISENQAMVNWNNLNNLGKYLICESREDNSTRLFIRNVTNEIIDIELKKWMVEYIHCYKR